MHQAHPTPAAINQAYASAPANGEHPLTAVLLAVAAGLPDPRNHYLVNTTYFDSPAGPVLLGALHLQAAAVRELLLEPDSFQCEVLLDAQRQQWSPVRVGFAQVWQVLQHDAPSFDLAKVAAAGGILYDAPQVLGDFARPARRA